MTRGVPWEHARGVASLLALALFCAGERAASAEPREPVESPEALELRWDAPPGCPPASAVRTAVQALAKLDHGGSGRLRASGVIRRDAGSWQLELTTEHAGISGERRLSARSCRALTDAATLTLALILNPDVELPASHPEASSDPAWRFALSARAGLHAGVSSELGPDFALGAGLAGDGPSLWALAAFAPPDDVRVRGSTGPGGRIWSISARLIGTNRRVNP